MLVANPDPRPRGRLIAAFLLGWVLYLLVCELAVLPVVSVLPAYSAEAVGLAALVAAGLSVFGLRRALAGDRVRVRAVRDGAAVLRWVDVFADEASGFWELTARTPDFARYEFTLRVYLVGFDDALDVRVLPNGAIVIEGPRGRVQAVVRHLVDAGAAHLIEGCQVGCSWPVQTRRDVLFQERASRQETKHLSSRYLDPGSDWRRPPD